MSSGHYIDCRNDARQELIHVADLIVRESGQQLLEQNKDASARLQGFVAQLLQGCLQYVWGIAQQLLYHARSPIPGCSGCGLSSTMLTSQAITDVTAVDAQLSLTIRV